MRTACPATGAAHAAFELRECLFDTYTPRFRLFAGDDPANPLVARERRNILPYR